MLKAKQSESLPSRTLRILSVVLFSLYLVLLVWLISLKCNMKVTITDTYYLFGAMTWGEKLEFAWDSFEALFSQNAWGKIFLDARQDTLNVVAFIPFGLYVAYFTKKHKLWCSLTSSLLMSFVFESLQLVTHIGCFGAIDLVTNTLGGLIGFFVYLLIYRSTPKRQTGLCIASVAALLIVVPLVCHAVTGTANMLDFYLDVLLRRL